MLNLHCVTVRFSGLVVDLLDLFLLSQGLPTSPSRCLEVWVNTPPTHTHTLILSPSLVPSPPFLPVEN